MNLLILKKVIRLNKPICTRILIEALFLIFTTWHQLKLIVDYLTLFQTLLLWNNFTSLEGWHKIIFNAERVMIYPYGKKLEVKQYVSYIH